MSGGLALVLWAAWLVAAGAVGRAVRCERDRALFSHLTGALIAFAAASLLLFVANQAAHLPLTFVSHLLAFCAVGGVALLCKRAAPVSVGAPIAEPWTRGELLAAGAFAFSFAVSCGWKLYAPFDDWDAFTYHLTLAAEVQGGAFPSGFGRSFIAQYERAFPPLLFHLYAFVLNGVDRASWPVVVKLLLLAVHAATCAYTWALARERFGLSRLAALGVLCFAGLRLPVAADQSFQEPALQEILTLYFLAGLYHAWGLLLDVPRCGVRAAATGALLFFGAFWTSYTALPLVGLVLGASIAHRLLRREGPDATRDALTLGALFTVLELPLLVRNQLVLGNALYPALLGPLGGKDITDWFLLHRAAVARPLRMPLVDMHFVLQAGGPVAHLVLAALAALFCADPKAVPRRAFWGAWIAGFVAVWAVAFQFEETPCWRYLFPLWPVAALLLGATFSRARPRQRLLLVAAMLPLATALAFRLEEDWPRGLFWLCLATAFTLALSARRWPGPEKTRTSHTATVAGLAVACWLVLTFPAGTRALAGRQALAAAVLVAAALGVRRKRPELLGAFPGLAAAAGLAVAFDPGPLRASWDHPVLTRDIPWMNAHLPPTSRVLHFEPRTFGLGVPFVPGDALGAEPFVRSPNRKEGLAALRAAGITHIWTTGTYAWPAYDSRVQALLTDPECTHVVYSNAGSTVAEVLPPGVQQPTLVP